MARIEEQIDHPTFASPTHRLRANLLFTADWLRDRIGEVLEPCGMTQQQFNVLRILRGQRRREREAAGCGEQLTSFSTSDLRARMITRASDTPRLVDRLVTRGWVHKQSCLHDARRVHLTITEAGLRALDAVDMDALDRVASTLTLDEMDRLSDLLDTLRG